MTVTLEPSLAQTLPSSKPITPAPMTPKVFGTSSKSSAPVLSIIFSPLNLAEPISIGDEPDAIIIFFDSTISLEPSSFVISTLPEKSLSLILVMIQLYCQQIDLKCHRLTF